MAVTTYVLVKNLEMQIITVVVHVNIKILALPIWLFASVFLDC